MTSLRTRLLLATLGAILAALALAGFTLSRLFQEQVESQFRDTLVLQLDQLTARLEFDANGQPRIDAGPLSDPRWQLPYSGLYWQLDEWRNAGGTSGRETGLLRSRSLWDSTLSMAPDQLGDGTIHLHRMGGPQQQSLMVVERTISAPGQSDARWRLMVAGDLAQTNEASAGFRTVLMLSLAVLMLLLMLAAWAQVHIGLLPLRSLGQGLRALRAGRAARLEGRFPAEVEPLAAEFNEVLSRNEQMIERARTHAGNLAHALKTPLTVIEQAAASRDPQLPELVREQVALAQRHIDWHLARARAAGSHQLPGRHADTAAALQSLVRTMRKLHAGRNLDIRLHLPDQTPHFAGEEQDLQEIIGNLLDNACKWARSSVTVSVAAAGKSLIRVLISDDGPGIEAAKRDTVLQRGMRLDESMPGSGLGLAIARDLAQIHGGSIELNEGTSGGLAVSVTLPAMVTN